MCRNRSWSGFLKQFSRARRIVSSNRISNRHNLQRRGQCPGLRPRQGLSPSKGRTPEALRNRRAIGTLTSFEARRRFDGCHPGGLRGLSGLRSLLRISHFLSSSKASIKIAIGAIKAQKPAGTGSVCNRAFPIAE